MALVATVRDNFEGYTTNQVEGAIKMHHFQATLGHSSMKNFKGMIHANLIVNSPMTTENSSHAYELFGKCDIGWRVKTVH